MDKKLLGTVKEHIKQGFQWGTREGPLCDERESLYPYPDANFGASDPLRHSHAQCQIPYIRCYPCSRANFPWWWTDRAYSASSMLLVFPDGAMPDTLGISTTLTVCE